MKITITLTILLLVATTNIAFAHWHGIVKDYDTEQNVPYADITTYPADATETSDGAGSFFLSDADGMVEGRLYSWVQASKGLKNGRNYVNKVYWNSPNWGPFYIYIQIPDK